NRAVKFSVQIDAEGPGIRRIIITVSDAFGRRGHDRALTEIGSVTQTIDLVFFLGRCGEAIIDVLKRVCAALWSKGDGFNGRSHIYSLQLSTQFLRQERRLTAP